MDTTLGLPEVDKLISLTKTDYATGFIDNPQNLQDSKVYLFSGTEDSVVHQDVMASLLQYYEAWIPASNIVADFDFEAEHCIPTPDYGEACTTLSSPYIGNCGYSGAGHAFNQLYGTEVGVGQMIDSNLYQFD